MFTQKRRTRAAISVEYIIILVLIAIGGIIGFIILGGQMRNQNKNIVDKLGGQTETTTQVNQADTTRLEQGVGMSGTEDDSQAQEYTTGGGGAP